MKRLTVLLTLAVFLVAANANAQMAPAGKGKPSPKPRRPSLTTSTTATYSVGTSMRGIGSFKTACWSSEGWTTGM